MIGDLDNRRSNDIGWAILLGGFRVASGIVFMGFVATVGRLLGAIDAHPAVSPLVWMPLAVAVGFEYTALLKRARGGAGRPGLAFAGGAFALALVGLASSLTVVAAPFALYLSLPASIVALAAGAFVIESLLHPRRISGTV